MNNLKTYEEYLNEGRIKSWFKGKHDEIGKKIYLYVRDNDYLKFYHKPDIEYCEFNLSPKTVQNLEIDPLCEDDWSNNNETPMIVTVRASIYSNYLKLDYEELDVSSSIIRKIYKAVTNREKRIINKRKQDRVDKAKRLLG